MIYHASDDHQLNLDQTDNKFIHYYYVLSAWSIGRLAD